MKKSDSIALLSLLTITASALADVSEPLYVANRSPVVMIHGLPDTIAATPLSANSGSLRATLAVASNFTQSVAGNEAVLFDGESYRYSIDLRYAWSDEWSAGLVLPYIHHQGGTLDGFINDWHDFFNLTDGGRNQVDKDALNYQWRAPSQQVFNLNQSAESLGDVSAYVSYQLAQTDAYDLAIRGAIKFATGDEQKLTGSGSEDYLLQLAFSTRQGEWRWHANAGLLYVGDSDVLVGDYGNDVVAFGALSLGWQASERIALKLQLDGHSAFYDSDLTEFGSSIQLAMGGDITLAKQWTLELAVIEDIWVNASPDVVFQLGLTRRFTE